MVLRIEIKSSGEAVGHLSKFPGKLRAESKTELNKFSKKLRDRIRENLRKSSARFTGKLANSFEVIPSRRGTTTFQSSVQSTSPYARIQEEGGTIRPKRKQYLTVPLTAKARARRARNFPGLFVVGKASKKILATKVGRRIQPQYALKKSVRLKGKRYIERSIAENANFIEVGARQIALEALRKSR